MYVEGRTNENEWRKIGSCMHQEKQHSIEYSKHIKSKTFSKPHYIKKLLLLLFVFWGIVLTNSSAAPQDAKNEKIIRIAVSGTPVIDPAVGLYVSSSIALVNIYDSLVFPSASTAEMEPAIAQKWDISKDGKEYTFYLRKGVKFHNGDELKASDVVFSTKRLLRIGEGYAYIFTDIIKDVVALNDYTVKFFLKKPFGPFLNTLNRLYILNERQVKEHIKPGNYQEWGDYGRDWLITHDAGSGPFMVKELVQQNYLYAVRFEEWYGGKWDPNAPTAFKEIDTTEASTIRTMMRNKELEITDMWQSSENLNAMSKLPGVEIVMYSALANQNMYFNTKKAPTDDVNFRKALACLFDYDMIIKNIFPGSSRSFGPVPIYVAGHVNTNQYNFDLDKAKEYLSKSKYANQLDQYPVEILCNSDVADHEKVALAFQAAARKIGIKVEITKAPWISIVDRVAQISTTPNLVSININAQYNEAGSMLETRYSSKSSGTFENGEWLLDKNLDSMIEDSLSTSNKEERYKKYANIQNKIVDEICPTAWLGDTLDRVACQRDYVYWPVAEASRKGKYVSNIYGYHYFFFDMRVYPDKK
ncbi:Extracellular solute-binding protein family 5 [uncultured spirochete]|jgi:peptide/nickel transport system substrate-binding protein|uniref:Extracellular solute-binding protein family 5 n=1 Tax=uncultured spirochete TaxID=156406 RepID=A0A3P3XQ71_9SPIR|nr:Extracellular solute-binding protein family 5 [uncultured spirochete]